MTKCEKVKIYRYDEVDSQLIEFMFVWEKLGLVFRYGGIVEFYVYLDGWKLQ